MIVLAVFLVFLFTEPAISLSNDHDNNTDTFVHSFCGSIAPIHPSNFIKNRNSTLAELRMQLLNQGKLYATAQDLSAGDTVYAAAQCRNYLSTDKCVACFDAGVSVLVKCDQATNKGNGAYVVFDDCFIRYEDFVDFYNNPSVAQDGTGTPYSECGDQSASQPNTTFEQVVDGLLTDIRDATPKAPNFYVALTREIASDDETVYAIGQCLGSKTACENCMNTAYSKLNECLPNTDGRFFDLGCFARYSKTPFFSDNQTTNVSNVLKGNSRKTIFAGTIAGLALFIFILIMWLAYQRRKKAKDTEQDLKVAVNYTYKDLQLATNNFGEENILGKGGFGEVFKATLDDNSIVAVKKLQAEHVRVKEEFENEVKLISHVHHRNLLRLLGWSSEGSERLLVLEYMSNGSLDRFLWGSKRGTLDWNQRYEIIFGIARGLAHLHNESSHVPIIHRDIKSTNILLTEDFKPKIADFGLARFLPEDKSHVSTQFAGTLGYTAPEYAVQGHLSDKVDTYSFGVVILEIISGRRSTQVKSSASSSDYLLEQAWKSYEKKIPMKFIDNTLDLNQYEKEHVMKTIEIALLCTQSFLKRPTMSEVVLMLQDGQSLGKRELTRPTFVNNLDRRVHIGSLKNSTAMGNVSRTQMN